MNISKTIQFAWKTKKTWFYTAKSKNKARFARTLLGGYWFGISNLLSIVILAIVYGTIFRVADYKNHILFIGLGLVIWQAFSHAVGGADIILEGNKEKIKSMNLNPIFYACETWAFEIYNFFQSFALVVLALSFIRPTLILDIAIYSLPSLLNFCLSIFWIPIILSIVIARIADFKQIVPVILQFLFLTSPILWDEARLGSRLKFLADYNPVYHIITITRKSILQENLLIHGNLILLAVNLLGMVIAIKLLDLNRTKLPFYL